MTYINPLIAPLAQGPQAQRAAAGKERQIARAQALTKNSAAEGDTLEHQVESADGLSAVGDDQPKNGQPRQQPRERKPTDADDDEKPRLDVTA